MGRTLLIVDDDPVNREILQRRLGRRGYEVFVAADGIEAIERVRAIRPDAVIMDLSMPVMDGYTTARALREDCDSAIAATPIIALSAHVFAGEQRRAMDAGFDAFETKPVDLDRVIETIEACVNRPRPR
ncbi:MAG: response regulator [Thermoanaerobaculia bacterium]